MISLQRNEWSAAELRVAVVLSLLFGALLREVACRSWGLLWGVFAKAFPRPALRLLLVAAFHTILERCRPRQDPPPSRPASPPSRPASPPILFPPAAFCLDSDSHV
jgi:hypothetical protein